MPTYRLPTASIRSPLRGFAVGMVLLASACSPGASPATEEAAAPQIDLSAEAPSPSAEVHSTEEHEADDNRSADSGLDADTTVGEIDEGGNDDAPTDEDTDAGADDKSSPERATPTTATARAATQPTSHDTDGGPCTRIQFPLTADASVININAGDPGLNLRAAPNATSANVATLSPGTVVETGFHGDIRCATDRNGGAWWYVYGDNERGWANTAFLAEHIDDAAPAHLTPASRKDDRAPRHDGNTGPCKLAEFRADGYADVINIPADDPDGGLNLRSKPSAGSAKVGTLKAGTEVATGFHSDIRCAVDANGNIWWYVYGDFMQGWANAAYLG